MNTGKSKRDRKIQKVRSEEDFEKNKEGQKRGRLKAHQSDNIKYKHQHTKQGEMQQKNNSFQLKQRVSKDPSSSEQESVYMSIKDLKHRIEDLKNTLKLNRERDRKISQVMRSYYNSFKYEFQTFNRMLESFKFVMLNKNRVQQFSKHPLENQIYVNEIKIKMYRIYTQALQNYDVETQFQYQIAWKFFYSSHIFNILENKKIIFNVFKLWNQKEEQVVRQITLRMLFETIVILLKQKIPDLKQIQKEVPIRTLFEDMKYFSYLIAKQPFIFCFKPNKALVYQTVDVIKNSWYITKIMTIFLRGLDNYLKKHHHSTRNQQIKQQQVKKSLKDVSVYFLDFAFISTNGFTLTKDRTKEFPILINLSTINKHITQVNPQFSKNLACSYVMYVLLHELAQSLVRKLQILPQGQDQIMQQRLQQQNYLNENIDTGSLFQIFAFGGLIFQCKEKDYLKFQQLLKITQQLQQITDKDLYGNFQKCQNFLEKQTPPNIKNTTSQTRILTRNNQQQIIASSKNQIENNQKQITKLENEIKAKKKIFKEMNQNSIDLILQRQYQYQEDSQEQFQDEIYENQTEKLISSLRSFMTLGLPRQTQKERKQFSLKLRRKFNYEQQISIPKGE